MGDTKVDNLSYFYGVGVTLFIGGVITSIATKNISVLIINLWAGILTSSFGILREVVK